MYRVNYRLWHDDHNKVQLETHEGIEYAKVIEIEREYNALAQDCSRIDCTIYGNNKLYQSWRNWG